MRISEINKNQPVALKQTKSNAKNHSANRLQGLSFDKSRALLSFGANVPLKLLSEGNNITVEGFSNSAIRHVNKGQQEYAFIKNAAEDKFDIKVLDGKHGTSVLFSPKDEKYKGLNILLTKGSMLSTLDKSVAVEIPPVKYSKTSFTGKFFASVGDKAYADKMENAYDEFFNQGIKSEIERIYKPNTNGVKDDYNFFTPTDGLGTRLGDVTYAQGGISKPAVPLPAKIAGKDYRLIHNTLSTFTKTGRLTDGHETIKVDDAKGSAYALLKGITEGTIGTDKPLVMTWGDAFSDLDLKEVLKEHESRGDAGLTIVCIEVDKDDIGSFGAVGLNKEGQIQKLVEKPKTLEDAEFAKIKGKDTYLGSVGPYILSKSVLKWVKEKAEETNMDYFLNAKGEYDFSSRILAPMVNLHKDEVIKDEEGNPLKMYTHTTNCNWSDIGTTSEFIEKMHDVNNKYNLPKSIVKDIKSNTSKSGLVFLNDSKSLYKELCADYGIKVKGNVIVSFEN